MMDAKRYIEALDRIEDPDVQAAFVHLLVEAERAGLTTSGNSGHVYAVRIHDRLGSYVFSYIANQSHLLFYLRVPALKRYPCLGEAARASEFAVATNPAGEITIRIENLSGADTFFKWLKRHLHD